VISDAFSAALLFVLLHRQMGIGQIIPQLARTALAAGSMGLIVWVGRSLPVGFTVVLGVVSYAAFATALRLVDWPVLLSPARRLVASWSRETQ
jgi:hypothetical protein